MKKVNALVLGLLVLLAFGCGKDEPEPKAQQQKKEVLTHLVRQEGTMRISQTFEYDSFHRPVKALNVVTTPYESYESYVLADYNSAGKIEKLSTYDTNNQMALYNTYHYLGNGQLEGIKYYGKGTSGGPISLQYYTTYTYDSTNFLAKRQFFDNLNALTWYETYRKLPTGEVQKDRYEKYIGTMQLVNTTEYTFDNENGINQLLSVFYDENFISPHNVSTMRVIPYPSNPVKYYYYSYTYNAAGYPTEQVIKNYPNPDLKNTFVYELR